MPTSKRKANTNGTAPAATTKGESAPQGYDGLWFHSFNEDGTIQWQGQILRLVEKDRWAVQLYSWMDGTPTHIEIVDRAQLSAFRLYANHRAMHEGWIETLPVERQDRARRVHKFLYPEAFGALDE